MKTAKPTITQIIATTGILTALSLIWTTFMYTVPLGTWSFTPFSHIFIFLGMYYNPITGIFVAIGTFFGFFIKGADTIICMRAGSQILFVILGMILLKKTDINKPAGMIIFVLSTALLHALAETGCVYLALYLNVPVKSEAAAYIWGATFGGTVVHSTLDCLAAYFLARLLSKRKIVHFTEIERLPEDKQPSREDGNN